MPRGVYDRHNQAQSLKTIREGELENIIQVLNQTIDSLEIQIKIKNQRILDLSEELLSCYRKLSPRA